VGTGGAWAAGARPETVAAATERRATTHVRFFFMIDLTRG
jgi:hypothetical protein